jgi:hypothetical protein
MLEVGSASKFHISAIQHTWTLKWVQQGTEECVIKNDLAYKDKWGFISKEFKKPLIICQE